jgi:hypothetical protein
VDGRSTRRVVFIVDTPDDVTDADLASAFAGMYARGPEPPGWWVGQPAVLEAG